MEQQGYKGVDHYVYVEIVLGLVFNLFCERVRNELIGEKVKTVHGVGKGQRLRSIVVLSIPTVGRE